jgi:hypothetical protein
LPRSKLDIFRTNVYMIYSSILNAEIYKSLIFFVTTGFLIPNYDDVTYYFLLDTCKISQESYDYLNMSQSIGIILGLVVYVLYLKNVEVWKLILSSLIFNLFVNTIQYGNFMRTNLKFRIGDIPINAFIMLLGKGTQTSLSVVPMTVMMMNVIPANIEASMFAFITAILTFSTDWGGTFVGGIVCKIFEIENDNMKKFGDALLLKNFLLLGAIVLT